MADLNTSEEYNGVGWTAGNNLGTAASGLAGCGTQAAGFAAGGNGNPSNSQWLVTHEYDGTSWTVGGAILTKRNNNGTWGSLTAGFTVGNSDYSATAETYDGTCWSAVDNEPAGKAKSPGIGQSGGGTSGLHHGGEAASGVLATTYEYSTLLTARSVTAS